MEKILSRLFNSTLAKNTWGAIAGSNTHRPIAKAASIFNNQKQVKATSFAKPYLKTGKNSNSLLLNALTHSSTFNYQSLNHWRAFSTSILSKKEGESKFDLLYKEGNKQLEQGCYSEAIQSYTQAIALNPQNALTFHNRGVAKFELEQFEAAIAEYDQAIARNPQAVTFSNRGLAKVQLGQFEAAIADYDQAIARNPQDAESLYNRGRAKVRLGQFEAAIADYDQIIALNPKDEQAFHIRGMTKLQLGQFEAALNDFTKAFKLDPHNIERRDMITKTEAMILEQQNTEQSKPKNKPF